MNNADIVRFPHKFEISHFHQTKITERLREDLTRYVLHGVRTDGFLEAVLSNNLYLVFRRGDAESLACLPRLLNVLWETAPSDCWGSPELVTRWLAAGERKAKGEA